MHNERLATHPPGSMALIEPGRSVTYGELDELVGQTAAGLLAAGVGRGDRVAILGLNDIAFVTGFLAAQRIGAVACPVASRNPALVLSQRLEAFSPVALLAGPTSAEAALLLRDEGIVDANRVGTAAGSPADGLLPLPFDEPARAVELDGSEASVILLTSGIVGAPRAAVLSVDNMASAQQRIIEGEPGLEPSDVSFAVLPFSHVLGLNMCLLPSLRIGASVVLQDQWDSHQALDLIGRHRVTQVVSVPPMWVEWLAAATDEPRVAQALESVTFARTGASALHPNVAEAVVAEFGIELGQGYGLTETAGTVTYEPTARRSPGSVGRPLDGVELRLVEDGREVEAGDRGEVWIRTGSVFQGYVDDAPATAEVLISDGWCRTGDVGILDDDGTLYLVGRSKDLINVSGFNVYPAEVEGVLEEHPGVDQAVVVGEAHEVTGEQVTAYVISHGAGDVDGDSVRRHCGERLSRYKIPATIHLVDRLPLTDIGKRVRNELR